MILKTSEAEFQAQFIRGLQDPQYKAARSVSGPGRSGALASCYASHILKIPFIPYGQKVPDKLKPHLVVDTSMKTGATIRKAAKKMNADLSYVAFKEKGHRHFWYESSITDDKFRSKLLSHEESREENQRDLADLKNLKARAQARLRELSHPK